MPQSTFLRRILYFLPFGILIFGAILRLYRLDTTMQFFGDQGRDALIARAILLNKDPAFIGPQTSIGNMYLGPFYYYFMVLPLLLTYPLPTGPAYAVALLGILTLWLVYFFGKQMFGERIALIAMSLYAVSPVIITYVRFSWNPNIVPLFALCSVWLVWKALEKKDSAWIGIGAVSAVLFQLHYIALTLIGAVGLVWMWVFVHQCRARALRRSFVFSTLTAIFLFIASLLPLVLFDLRHDFLNLNGFLGFFQSSDGPGNFRSFSEPSAIFFGLLALAMRLLFELYGIVIARSEILLSSLLLSYISLKLFFVWKGERKTRKKQAITIVLFFSIASLFVLSLYRSSVYDHYLGFFFPIGAYLLAILIDSLYRSIFLRPLAVFFAIGLFYSALLRYPGTQQLGANVYAFSKASSEIAQFLPDSTRYNLLVYTPTRDLHGMNYRYFLTTLGRPPVAQDEWVAIDTLVVIDEEGRSTPFDESQYAIANWPNRIVREQHVLSTGAVISILSR